jgi:hypothetical protein
MAKILGVDLGYKGTKIWWENQFYKIASTINYYNDSGIKFGETDVYEFEGEKYVVGVPTDDSFVTTDYNFLRKFGPLIVFHIIKKLGINEPIEIRTGLALVDWGDQEKRDDFIERLSTITCNGETITNEVTLVGPQGDGSFRSYIVSNNLQDAIPNKISIIDIGYKTINFLHYVKGKPDEQKSKGFPDHGVVTIIKPFTAYLEHQYNVPFSEQEAAEIFLENRFTFGGVDQENVIEKIEESKIHFVQKLMNSILVSEKKTLQLSDVVVISGGRAYMLQDIDLPPNVVIGDKFLEFDNVKGYIL